VDAQVEREVRQLAHVIGEPDARRYLKVVRDMSTRTIGCVDRLDDAAFRAQWVKVLAANGVTPATPEYAGAGGVIPIVGTNGHVATKPEPGTPEPEASDAYGSEEQEMDGPEAKLESPASAGVAPAANGQHQQQEQRQEKKPSDQPAKRRRAPDGLPDPGLTVVTDSGLPKLIGHVATAVWLCMLRHANGRPGRLVKAIGYNEVGEGTGLSRQQIRDGFEVLIDLGPVEKTKEGQSRDGVRLTAEYIVHFPTTSRIERWLVKATKKESA